jgi:hypothetical protein
MTPPNSLKGLEHFQNLFLMSSIRRFPEMLSNSSDSSATQTANLPLRRNIMLTDALTHPTRYTWSKANNGNFIHIDGGNIIATVFRHPRYQNWRCVINTEYGGHHPQQAFDTSKAAISHAENLIPRRHQLQATRNSKPAIGSWGQQAKRYCGAESYGRQFASISLSVRRAESGKWIYVPYAGATTYEPRGFYDSPTDAKAAADNEYLNHHQRPRA